MKTVSMLAVGLLLAASATTAVAQNRSREIDYGDRAESREEGREKRPAAEADSGYRSGAPRGGYDASGRTDRYDASREATRDRGERFAESRTDAQVYDGRRDGNRYDGNRYDGNRYDGRRDGNRYDGRRDGNRYDGNRYDDRRYGDHRDGRRGDYRHGGRYNYRHDGWSYRTHGYRNYSRYRAPSRYYRPRGYYSYSWSVGHRLPPAYYGPTYYIDYRPYGLAPPPYGYRWVRIDNDVVLVAIATGLIADILSDFFYY